MASFSSSLILLLQTFLIIVIAVPATHGFVFNGFKKGSQNLTLDQYAVITPAGALQLTNVTSNIVGRAFFSTPIKFFNSSSTTVFSNSTNSSSSTNTSTPTNSSQPHSFATHFVFSITPVATSLTTGGHGMTFVLSSTNTLPQDSAGPALGFTTRTNGGNASSNSTNILAVEFDTVFSANGDLMGDHVGIDINSYKSVKSAAASYHDGASKNISLVGTAAIQAWVEYNGAAKEITVTIAPMKLAKPKKPLLSYKVDLSKIIKESMYVGFTASTGNAVSTHSVLGWSFGLGGGPAPKLDVGRLPAPPRPQCVIRR